MTEKEQIVRWLRVQAGTVVGNLCASDRYIPEVALADVDLIENIADRIERGDHLSNTKG